MADAFDPRKLLETLVRHGVDFVLIGGMAGTARGSAYVTLDVDVAYERSRPNPGDSPAPSRSSARRFAAPYPTSRSSSMPGRSRTA